MFQTIRQAIFWFVAYLGLIALSIFFDSYVSSWAVSFHAIWVPSLP